MAAAQLGCAGPPPLPPPPRYAGAEQVELNFRAKRFVLGDNDSVALVRPVDWPQGRFLKLPFWLGTHVLVPGVLQPKQGDYYVISEAILVRRLDRPGEWMIEAGSSLLKKETVFVTTRTHYKSLGRILPTIVQYAGDREFHNAEGNRVEIAVLREVSLPMEWTLGGPVPKEYARYESG